MQLNTGNTRLRDVLKECLKKNADTFRWKRSNNHRDLLIILKLLSSRQHEQQA